MFKATTVALWKTHGWRGCCTTPSCCLQLFCLVVVRRKPVKLLGKWFPPPSPTHTSARERSEEKAGYIKWDSQQIKGLRTFVWSKETVHDVYIPVSKYNRCSKLLNGTHHYDFTLNWLILMKFVVHKFIPNLHQANVPSSKRGNNVLWFKRYPKILSSDKNCCIVSLSNYEKERSKTIVTWKQSSD